MPAWISALQQFLEQRDGAPAELIETHISWVLLSGPFAYKLKKPVNFGFLNFSTLDLRKKYCEEELRLNGRLAPQLYLRTAAITGSPSAPELDGSGEPWEYAVVMTRFEQSHLLGRELAEHRLEIGAMDRLADALADFHATVATAGPETPFGRASEVRSPVDENLASLRSRDIDGEERDLVEQVAAWCESEHDRLAVTFETRRLAGKIRECHGDLHLGNMVLIDGQIVIFDGIEFSESLRWIDVASEIAFCVMDLEDRGFPEYAHRLLNRYLERTGDYGLLEVLPYYVVYRATVRAKVAELRRAQGDAGPAEQERLRQERKEYLQLATRWTKPKRRWLAITFGVSGSGKTCGTQPLVDHYGAIRIRSDVERKRLFGCEAESATPDEELPRLYSTEASAKTYDRLGLLTKEILAAGFPVIVDATFLKHQEREPFFHIAAEQGLRLIVIEFTAPESELVRRVNLRRTKSTDASDATGDVVRQQLNAMESITAEERKTVDVLDGSAPDLAVRLMRSLKSLRPVTS